MEFVRKFFNKINAVLFVLLASISCLLFSACKQNGDSMPTTKYTVKFYDGNNQLIKTVLVDKGKDAVEPTEAERYMPGYIFHRWDADFTNVQSDLNVYGGYFNDPTTDTDGDGIIDYIEIEVLDLDYLKQDSDNDSILDGDEDFDNDGLTNLEEITTYFTKPNDADTDDDGVVDGVEIENETDPTDPSSF